MKTCSMPDCSKKHYAHGLCNMHYMRKRNNGDPAIARRPPNGSTQKWLDEVALNLASDDCLPFPFSIGSHGYGAAMADGENICSHVYVCTKKHGPKPSEDCEAIHSCRMKICVNWRHLRWGTHTENMRDKLRDGTSLRGESHPLACLSREDVLKIRGMPGKQAEIGDLFGVSQQTVSDIKSRRRWAWL